MIKILFVCLGNICRSPMAEFMCKDMLEKLGRKNDFYIESAGTSNEEEGNPIHYGAREKLAEVGIFPNGKYARQIQKSDYDRFDYIIAMEEKNISSISCEHNGIEDEILNCTFDSLVQYSEEDQGDYNISYKDECGNLQQIRNQGHLSSEQRLFRG